jgi:hypothetical protein
MAIIGHHMAATLPACTHAMEQSAAGDHHQWPRPHAQQQPSLYPPTPHDATVR